MSNIKEWKAATNCPFLTELNRLASKPKFASLPDGYFVGMTVRIPTVKVTLLDASERNQFTGIAKCAPTDAFSVMTGFSIAATRAMKKQLVRQNAQTSNPYINNYHLMKSEVEYILGRNVHSIAFTFEKSRRVLIEELKEKGASTELLAAV